MGTMMALRAHALIAVHAAAITFAELTWDLEWTTRDGKDRAPVIPSHEMSGTTFPLAEGQKAFESGGGARRPGKTVLVVR
jgi:hypothetical protein